MDGSVYAGWTSVRGVLASRLVLKPPGSRMTIYVREGISMIRHILQMKESNHPNIPRWMKLFAQDLGDGFNSYVNT